mmetsp:Transcript_13297/g.48408  ORF Transcript_13297/g.48408 Transcript_13297/m.48408 type:complete len:154 (-) Transcript_13297:2070-2531(-)|eukprot:scaffold4518_cov410-Prasinococcus_capsulatus_cf.AAC.17
MQGLTLGGSLRVSQATTRMQQCSFVKQQRVVGRQSFPVVGYSALWRRTSRRVSGRWHSNSDSTRTCLARTKRVVKARASSEESDEESASSIDMDALRKRLETMQEAGLDRDLVEKENVVAPSPSLLSNDQFGYLFLLLLLVAGFLLLKVAILY